MTDLATGIVTRLSNLPDLRLPGQLIKNDNVPTLDQKHLYLENLLTHDAGVFLERYGDTLTADELQYFEPLRAEYEVDFYLRLYQQQNQQRPPPSTKTKTKTKTTVPKQHTNSLSATAKNRRLAAMQRLMTEGEYFSEEAMRERAPYLHHLYIGQYNTTPNNNAITAPPPLQQQQQQQDLSKGVDGIEGMDVSAAAVIDSPSSPVAGSSASRAAAAASTGGCSLLQQQQPQKKRTDNKTEQQTLSKPQTNPTHTITEEQAQPSSHPSSKPQQQQADRAIAPSTLASSIMHWQTELDISHRRYKEQERYELAEEESETDSSNEEEEERKEVMRMRAGGALEDLNDDDSKQEKERQENNVVGGSGDGGGDVIISEELREEYRCSLLEAMQQNFLNGKDTGINYNSIDTDSSLDDDFADQVNRDAEDTYFDED